MLPISQWAKDSDVHACTNGTCGVKFSLFTRRHHCRVCGNIFCGSCSKVHEAFANTRLCTPCFDISWRQFQNGDKPEVEVDMTFVTDIIDQLQVNMEEDMERHKESLRQQLNNKHDKFKEEDTENKENARDDNGSLSEPKIRTPSHNNVLIKGTTDNGSTKSPPLHTKIDNIFHHAEDSNRKLIEKYKAMLTVETKRQAILATRRNSQDILREVRLTIDSKANETAPSKGARGENKKNGLLTHTTPRRRRNRTDTGSKPRSITRSARRTGDNMSCFGSVPRGTLDRSPTNNMHPRALTNDLEAAEEDEMGRTDSGLATNQPNATDMKQMQNTWWAQELERQRIRDENWAEERRLMQERNKHLRTMASSEQTSTPSAQPHRSNTQPSHLNASCELNLTGLSDILGGSFEDMSQVGATEYDDIKRELEALSLGDTSTLDEALLHSTGGATKEPTGAEHDLLQEMEQYVRSDLSLSNVKVPTSDSPKELAPVYDSPIKSKDDLEVVEVIEETNWELDNDFYKI